MKQLDQGKAKMDSDRLLRIKEVLKIIPVSKSTWWKWIREGKAPQPIHLGTRCTFWRHSDLIDLTN